MDFLTDIFEYRYLANAVLACLLSGITCGIVGSYIVARRMVFLCGGITHASFGGLGIAFWAGFNPILGALLFAVASSLGIEYINRHTHIRKDSAIGLMWGVGMALGALFMSLRPGYTSGDLSAFLFGNIITVTSDDVLALAALALFLVVGAALWLKPIIYSAFDSAFSRSAGLPVAAISYVMSVVVAVAIVLSIRVMGVVLLISLMTMPVVIVNLATKDYRRIVPFASLVASLGAVGGIVLSYYMEVPSGPAIIFVLSVMLVTVKLLSLPLKRLSDNR